MLGAASGHAAPLSGSRLGNQAVATYLDSLGVPRTVVSNLVEVQVTQVAGVTLVPDNTLFSTSGASVSFPHTVTNTGNAPDIFNLSLTQLLTDNYDLVGAQIYSDFDANGVADDLVNPITSTPSLAPGQAFSFVIQGQVPVAQPANDVAQLEILATSQFDPTVSAGPRTDTVTVTANAVVQITKSISQNSGLSPSGANPAFGYTVELAYSNGTSVDSSVIRLTDTLPTGMTFKPGTATWALTGAATILTEASDGFEQSVGANQIDFQLVGNTVLAVIQNVRANTNGVLRFRVEIAPGVAPTTLYNTATLEYDDGTGGGVTNVGPVPSNAVPFTILPSSGVTIVAANSPIANAPQNTVVVFRNVVTNTGNGPDRFDIELGTDTYPVGTIFTLYKSDGISLLLDTDGSGLPDTGPMDGIAGPGPNTYDVFVRVQLPPAVSGFGPFTLPKTAISAANSTVRDTTNDVLTEITAATVSPDIDLIAHTASDPTPNPGDPETFTLTWQNVGTSGANSVPVIVDSVPANFVILRAGITNTTFTGPASTPGAGTILYHREVDPAGTYVTVPPPVGQTDYVALGVPVLASGQIESITFTVEIKLFASEITCAATAEATDPNTGDPILENYPPITIFVGNIPPQIEYHYDPNFNLIVDHTPMNRPLYVQARAASLNDDPFTVEVATITIVSNKTGDSETFPLAAIETGPNTGIFQLLNGGGFVPTESFLFNPVVANDGTLQAAPNDVLRAEITAAVGGVPITVNTTILIDPAGIVFDSQSGLPVAGATVTLIDVAGAGNGGNPGGPAVVFFEGGAPAPSTVVTGADGFFQFPLVAASTYAYQVQTPAGYTFASILPPAQLPPGFRIDPLGSYGGTFPVNLITGAVFIDVPIDPQIVGGLLVQKTASRSVAELGESIDYSVVVKNGSPLPMQNTILTDVLPRGLRYLKGSARLANGTPIADPGGGLGQTLTFPLGLLAAGTEVTVVYRAQIGAGVHFGDTYNTAQATTTQAGINLTSNVSRARVHVRPGVFTDRGVLIGRVYVDLDKDSMADLGEPGVPGVRVYLEDGTFAITDLEGKYSLHGISSRTHVARVDALTLPPGATTIRLRNRHGDRPWSRFVDIRGGELHKTNFAIHPDCPNILANVAMRKRKAEIFVPEIEKGLTSNFVAAGPLEAFNVQGRDAEGFVGNGKVDLADFDLPEEVDPDAKKQEASENQETAPASVAPPVSGSSDTAKAKWAWVDAISLAESLNRPAPPKKEDGSLDYETIMESLSSKLGFVNLEDGAVLKSSQARVLVKGHKDATLKVTLNGEELPSSRIGARAQNPKNQVQLIEYVGISLKPGSYVLELSQMDGFGNPRGTVRVNVRAPGTPVAITIETPDRNLPADGKTMAPILVRLLDKDGLVVPARVQVTLETDVGRFNYEDPAPGSPGMQVFVNDGESTFDLTPPIKAANGTVRVTYVDLKAESEVYFVPPLRDMIIVGIVEGKIYKRKLNLPVGALEPETQGDPFETEFVDFFGEGAGTSTKADARTAFFLKGKVRGERLLTVSYDSEKDPNQRLFRDIQPEEFYPIYGDSSVKGYDAQSTSKLYVRLDKGANYSLYGDFDSRRHNVEENELGSYTRSMTGLVHHRESKKGTVTAFASKGSSRQVIDEIGTNGTSGPYQLTNSFIQVNSEKVEILVRDRNQPAVILSVTPQTRFRDYALEPFSGRIVFKAPEPSVDEFLNPRSVRVTYELESGGKEFWRTGVAGQAAIGRKITVGGSYAQEDDPLDKYEIASVHAGVQISEDTKFVFEAARTDRRSTGKGDARRVLLTHKRGKLDAALRAGTSDATFDNQSAPLANGREELRFKASYQLDGKTILTAESLRTGDTSTNGHRTGHSLGVIKKLNNGVVAEFGIRKVEETNSAAQPTSVGAAPVDFTSARLKLTTPVGKAKRALVYGEYEQDLEDSDKRLFAIGGELKIHEKTRIYARHELISSLGGRFSLNSTQNQNSTVVGIDSEYMKNGKVFSEYRGRDAFAGRETEAAIGLRNKWHLGEGLRLNTSFEKVDTLQGVARESMAIAAGLEYTKREDFKATSRLEFRDNQNQDTWLASLGLAYKIDKNWSTLGRYIQNRTESGTAGVGDRVLARLQLGVAYRPVHDDRFNGLFRYENRVDDDPGAVGGGSKRDSDIWSLHLNHEPTSHWVVTTRFAMRDTEENYAGLRSNSKAKLIGGRVTHDIGRRWDVGIQASRLFTEGAGAQKAWGLELGRQLGRDIWLSFGYNFTGFDDPELVGEDYTERGVYFRMRAKFDEETFRRHPRDVAKPEDCAEAPAPEPIPVAFAPFKDRLPETLKEVRAEDGKGTPRLAPSYAVGRSALIRILAPARTSRVSAVFPWGETKPLERRGGTDYWATRFLVPESSPHGVYDVALVLTDEDGTRQRLDYTFHADRKPPEGRATAEAIGSRKVYVEVGSSKDVRRAEVALPNGEYVELAQGADESRWSGTISLPPGASWEATVPVMLYDTAHNLLILEVEVAQ